MGDNTLTVKRVLHAPIEKVWNAWTVPSEQQHWLSPEGMTTPETEVDLTVGGSFKIAMQDKDGNRHVAIGKIKEIEKPHKLVLTWQWEGGQMGRETLLTLNFKKVSENATELTLIHDLFASKDERDMHKLGWESTCNKLEAYLKRT